MDAPYYNGSDMRPWPSVADRDEEMRCPYCDCRESEPHHPACNLYEPICACGRVARRHVDGVPKCTWCSALKTHIDRAVGVTGDGADR